MQRDLRQVVDVLDLTLLIPGVKDLFMTATDPHGYPFGNLVYRLGYPIGLTQDLDVVRTFVKEVYIHACPTVDGLVIIPCNPNFVRVRSDLIRHLPLQGREVLSLIDKQVVQVG